MYRYRVFTDGAVIDPSLRVHCMQKHLCVGLVAAKDRQQSCLNAIFETSNIFQRKSEKS